MAALVGRFALAVLATLILPTLIAPEGAADWWQSQGDASARGFATTEGPTGPDVAWTARLPEPATTQPMMVGPSGFVGTATGLYRVDLERGAVARVAEIPRAATQIAGDGSRIFVLHPGYTLTPGQPTPEILSVFSVDGARLWAGSLPRLLRDTASGLYGVPNAFLAVEGRHVYVAGTLYNSRAVACAGPACDVRAFLLQMEAETGAIVWSWYADALAATSSGQPAFPVEPVPSGLRPEVLPPGKQYIAAAGVAADPNAVYLTTKETTVFGGELENAVYAISATDGRLQWARRSPLPSHTSDDLYTNPLILYDGPAPGAPMRTGTSVLVKLESLHELDAASGETRWRSPIPLDVLAVDFPPDISGMAASGGGAFGFGGGQLYAVLGSGERTWLRLPPVAGDEWGHATGEGTPNLVVAGSMLYALAASREGTGVRMHAFEAGTGALRWQQSLESARGAGAGLAASDGNILVAHGDSMTLFGRTVASIVPALSFSLPDPFQPLRVQLNLSGTKPGAMAPATLFSLDWGDGFPASAADGRTLWEHSYSEPGTYVVLVRATNEAGQSSTARARLGLSSTPIAGDATTGGEFPAVILPTNAPPTPAGAEHAPTTSKESKSSAASMFLGAFIALIGAVVGLLLSHRRG